MRAEGSGGRGGGAFEEYGTVTDAYNPGKGFAFVTFSKPSEATAAMEALEGQEVCGNVVNINIAKPKGGEGTPRGGGRGGRGGGGAGRRQEEEGSKLFVHNVSEDTAQDDLYNAFSEHGTVTDAYNPGSQGQQSNRGHGGAGGVWENDSV